MDQKFVNLVPGTLQVEMDKDMNLFDVVNWSLDYTSDAKETVEMKVRLKRKPKSELLTTFLPTILLTSITFATSFFKPFFFEAALSVNLTTMLVMTTIFISKMEGLPPTSDIKMIDIWLVLCQMVPFAEVVLLTAMEYNREDKKKRERKTKKKGGKKRRNLQTISLIAFVFAESGGTSSEISTYAVCQGALVIL